MGRPLPHHLREPVAVEPPSSPMGILPQRRDGAMADECHPIAPPCPDPGQDPQDAQPQTGRDRRAHPRIAASCPIEFVILSRFKHWAIRPAYRATPSTERNPTGSLAIPACAPWIRPYMPLVRFLEELLFEGSGRSWDAEGQV
ncbi:MAG: hypothetical protein FJ246_07850, partial [Nitrospira sp.]|nr:hypothetical protein [Nitrospira sp.]